MSVAYSRFCDKCQEFAHRYGGITALSIAASTAIGQSGWSHSVQIHDGPSWTSFKDRKVYITIFDPEGEIEFEFHVSQDLWRQALNEAMTCPIGGAEIWRSQGCQLGI